MLKFKGYADLLSYCSHMLSENVLYAGCSFVVIYVMEYIIFQYN